MSYGLTLEKKNCGRKHKADDFDKCAIRQIVHEFFANQELPTLDKILHEVKNNENITKIGRTSLYKI